MSQTVAEALSKVAARVEAEYTGSEGSAAFIRGADLASVMRRVADEITEQDKVRSDALAEALRQHPSFVISKERLDADPDLRERLRAAGEAPDPEDFM